MFLLILVQIYKKNRGKPHVERNIYKEKTYIIRWGLIFSMKKGDFLPVNATFACGEISPTAQKLIMVTEQSFYEGIKFARQGNRISDIGHEVSAVPEYQSGVFA